MQLFSTRTTIVPYLLHAIRMAVLLVLSLCSLTPPLSAITRGAMVDKITFTNGDVSSGTVISANDKQLVFQGTLTGTVTYQWQDIAVIQVSSATSAAALAEVQLPSDDLAKIKRTAQVASNATDLSPSAIAAETSSASVAAASDAQTPQVLPKAVPPAAGVVPHWGGSISTQDTVTRATQDQYQLGGSIHLSYETYAQEAWKHQFLLLDSTDTFSEGRKPQAPVVKTALFEGTLTYQVDAVNTALQSNFPNKYDDLFMFAFADGYHNLSLGIDTEQSYGGGFGWTRTLKSKAGKTGKQLTNVFGLQADLRYADQNLYPPGQGGSLVGMGVNEHYALSIPRTNQKLKPFLLSETITTIPYFNNPRSFEVKGSTVFSFNFTPNLSIGPKVDDDYFRNAPHTSKQNYFQPSLTLTYNFIPTTK